MRFLSCYSCLFELYILKLKSNYWVGPHTYWAHGEAELGHYVYDLSPML